MQSFSEFESTYTHVDVFPLYDTLPLPKHISPIDFVSSVIGNDPFILLEGVSEQVKHNQFTYLGLKPYLTFKDTGTLITETIPSQNHTQTIQQNLYDYIQTLLNRYQRLPKDTPPFSSGIMGMLSYESVQYLENITFKHPRVLGLPYASFMIPQAVLVVDNLSHTVQIVCNIFTEHLTHDTHSAAYTHALQLIEEIKSTFLNTTHVPFSPLPLIDPYETMDYTCSIDKDTFLSHVEKCKQYINEGDIFQIQVSRRISIPFQNNPMLLYRHLRHHNPSPFMFYVHLDNFHLIGSSPEILVNVEDNRMIIRPIAGTRKRYSKDKSEANIINELQNDEKEKAEHIMLVDLARNDVGRACINGSVQVNDLMYIEKYSHVVHMVSDVDGTLEPGKTAVDALKYGFPAGTVTGAPKIRAMEIIEELESEQREFYSGGIVFFDFQGGLKSALTIRTILVKDNVSYTQAAAGIVADSVPEMELLETENKMKMCLSAMFQYGTEGASS